MFSHVMVGVSDLEVSRKFYDALLGTIGVGPGFANKNRYFYRSATGNFAITTPINGQPATKAISDDAWLKGPFIDGVQKRGAAVIKARGASSAASAANAVIDTVKSIVHPTAAGDCFSAAMMRNTLSVPSGSNWEVGSSITMISG